MATGRYVTHEELAVALEGVATENDLEQLEERMGAKFATKEDLERFATKEDLERFATKEDLERFATKEDLERFAAKEDLEQFATKQDLRQIDDKLEARFAGLYALIRDYLLNDTQRDDWDHRNGS